MTAPTDAETTTIDIKVATPLKASVLLTLEHLIDAAWLGAQLAANVDRYANRVIFRGDNSQQQDVDGEQAAALRIEPDEFDLDVTELNRQGVKTLTPGAIGSAFLPVIKETSPTRRTIWNPHSSKRRTTNGTS